MLLTKWGRPEQGCVEGSVVYRGFSMQFVAFSPLPSHQGDWMEAVGRQMMHVNPSLLQRTLG